jgi:hypothetical protein
VLLGPADVSRPGPRRDEDGADQEVVR